MLSILIPTYNYNIEALVTELHAQATACGIDFEILCYDDCSTNLDLIASNKSINLLKNTSYKVLKSNIGRSAIRNLLAKDAHYDLLLFLNRQLHKARKAIGLPYWSLASYLKSRVKKANEAIERYKLAALNEAIKQQVDGVVCGHIHHPQICLENGIMYCNDGDWVENCTLLVETEQGDLKLLQWNDAIDNIEVLGQVNWSKPQQNNKNRQVDRKWVS